MDDSASGLVGLGCGRDAQERALTAFEDSESLGSQGRERALPPDESLDGAVGEHDGFVAGLGRGGSLREHHAGVNEGHSLGLEALGSLPQLARVHGHSVLLDRLLA
jgi:hypothetical protein